MTKQNQVVSPEGQAGIEITEEMIEAGVAALRDFHIGQDEGEIVQAVFLAMAIERQHIERAAART